MNSNSLQQNFILFLEKTKETKEATKTLNGRLCCEKCRFSTKDTALFERHVAQHEEVTFSCTICNHISYSRVESQRHLVKHKGSFPYKCNWCAYGAVRRDYMVKHIQRIHGKLADGIFTTDLAKKPDGTKSQYVPTPRTLGGPSHDLKVVTHSAGNVSSLLSSAIQTRPSPPYHVSSTTCSPPIIKSQPYTLPTTTHTVCKVTQGIIHSSNVTVKDGGPAVGNGIDYMKKMTEKASLEKTAVSAVTSLPRVHVSISGDRAPQQKPPLQSQVVGTTEKTANQSKTIPKVQVGVPATKTNHLKTLLSNHNEAPIAQKPIQKIPVTHLVQRSVSSLASPTISVEQFRQGVPSIKRGAQTPGKDSQHKTRTNILVRTPPKNPESSAKSGVQVGLLAALSQPPQHNRPSMIPGPEVRTPPQSNVQVELLAPLNQPIQHNKPLTVSCPEEITIPAGCLVELVEVKNVNGTRELELRLVPQQLTGPQQGDLKKATVKASTNRLSFKCRVATDDNQAINMNHEINTPKASAVPEHPVHGSHLWRLCTSDSVNVKNEADANEKGFCPRKNGTEVPGSSSKWLHAVSRSVASNPSESHKFMQQARAGHKNAAKEQVKRPSHKRCTVKNIPPRANKKNVSSEGLKFELRAAQPAPNKQEDAELSRQGLPIISSVFSLCPIPQDSPGHVSTRGQDAQTPVAPRAREDVKNTDNPGVCSPTLKTEVTEQKEEIFEESKALEEKVKERPVALVEKTVAKGREDKIPRKLYKSSPAAPPNDPLPGVDSSSPSTNGDSIQPENLESEKSLVAQTDSTLASSMNPIVTLIRMPSLEFFSASKAQDKRDGEESVTARPVVCCTSNPKNVQERTIKLVLKRKWSETKTSPNQKVDLVCVGVPLPSKKAKRERKKAKKHKSAKDQRLFGKGTTVKMCLTPLKDDQLVKLPGPNQPVVVLNHPNPLVSPGAQTLNYQHCRNSAADLSNPNGTTQPTPVSTCPAFKMTLKKVQGQKYQVTKLLLQGVSDDTVL